MSVYDILKSYESMLEGLIRDIASKSITRNIGSRIENPIVYLREVEPRKPLYLCDKIISLVAGFRAISEHLIIGVDGSSRVIDTPYMFIGLASVVAYSRILGEILDHPPLPAKYVLPQLKVPFIAVSPDTEELRERIKGIDGIITHSPAGAPYAPDYNKSLILDELRVNLETRMIIHVGLNIRLIENLCSGKRIVMFIDGPIYPVPNIFRQHYNLLHTGTPERGRLDDYVASWRELLIQRIYAIRLLEKRGVPVVGIVKRLESSRMLIASNYTRLLEDFGLRTGDPGNDQALIDIVIRAMISKGVISQPYSPMIIGPLKIPPESTYLNHYIHNVPAKIAYYIIVPLHKYGEKRLYYTVFRFETTEYSAKLLEEIVGEPYLTALYDSVCYGTTLPSTILYADKRSKVLSRSLANILARDLESRGIPLTYDTIRAIEAYRSE